MRKISLVSALLATMSLPAFAQTTSSDGIVFRGFGTIAAEKVEGNNRFVEEYRADHNILSYANDSKLAVNFTSKPNSNSRVVVQGIMIGSNENFTPQLDLATYSMEIASNFSAFAGRVVAPIWMYSEEQSIGYSYAWNRPPIELYGQIPLRNVDGIGVRYSHAAGPTLIHFQALTGQANYSESNTFGTTTSSTMVNIRDFAAAELRIEQSSVFGLRIGYAQASFDGDTVVELANVAAAGGINVRQSVLYNVPHAHLYSLGAHGDFGKLTLTAEYAKIESPGSFFSRYNGAYATLTYVLPSWTLHVTESWMGNLDGLKYALDEDPTQTDRLKTSHSTSYGVNYTKFDNLVIKAGITQQSEHFDIRNDNNYAVYTVSTDFIF